MILFSKHTESKPCSLFEYLFYFWINGTSASWALAKAVVDNNQKYIQSQWFQMLHLRPKNPKKGRFIEKMRPFEQICLVMLTFDTKNQSVMENTLFSSGNAMARIKLNCAIQR